MRFRTGFWEPPKTPLALMDIHGKLDDTIPANATNGYQYPNYTAPHGGSFSDDGMYYTNNTVRKLKRRLWSHVCI
jgi:hypothetical protein